jgi:5,6,7,8-tetrahydromethanopterin hydro-lyase
MAQINDVRVGESLVGDGNEVAHIDLIMGPRGSAAEAAFCNALTNNKDGFTSLLAVVAPNLATKPNTVMFNKVTIKGAGQAVQMFGPAQRAVAMAVADSVEDGTIAADQADDLFICVGVFIHWLVGVFIHWLAEDDRKIQDYNYQAVKESIERAVAGSPTAAEAHNRTHPRKQRRNRPPKQRRNHPLQNPAACWRSCSRSSSLERPGRAEARPGHSLGAHMTHRPTAAAISSGPSRWSCSALADQHAAHAETREQAQVVRATQAAGAIDLPVPRPPGHGPESIHVGSLAGADPGQGHDDDPLGPEVLVFENRRRTEEGLVPEVQGQDHTPAVPGLSQPPDHLGIVESFAADHQVAQAAVQPVPARGQAGQPLVDPEAEVGKGPAQEFDDRIVVTALSNCVQIGDIEGPKGMDRQVALNNVQRIATGTEP